MGKVTKHSALGRISGRVGDVVFVPVNDEVHVKGRPAHSQKNKEGSEKQKANRAEFKAVGSYFGSFLDKVFAKGYQPKNKDDMQGKSAAVSYHLLNAVTGQFPHLDIDVSKIRLSRPVTPIENGWKASFSLSEEGGFDVKWEMNPFPPKSTRFDDKAVIVLRNLKYKNWIISDNEERRTLFHHFVYRGAKPVDFCAWIFFVSADGKRVSETQYLGALTRI